MATPLKLHDYVDQYAAALAWLEEHEDEIREAGGELPPELVERLDQIEDDVREKVRRIGNAVQDLTDSAKAADAAAQRIAAHAASFRRHADALKEYLRLQLGRVDLTKVETPTVKVRIQRNSRPSIRPLHPDVIPARYQRVRVEFDGTAAYEDLSARGLLPEKPGTVHVDDLVVTLGEHVRVW